jgi:ParB/RepB/Spo0J family partition protein
MRGGARSINPDRVNQLADSISDVGLQSPIVVRACQDAGTEHVYQLLAGNHRYAALRKLKAATIPAFVIDTDDLHAEMIVIDENLCREALTPAQEALAVSRRKQIYEELHPETAHGGNRKSSRQFGDLKPERFTKATAAVTGRSERRVQRLVTRAEKIGPAALGQIVGTSLDQGGELDALAGLPADEQKCMVERASAGEKVSARSRTAADITILSSVWRAKFTKLMNETPTKEDCEWAVEQARRFATGWFPDIPHFLDRRTPTP